VSLWKWVFGQAMHGGSLDISLVGYGYDYHWFLGCFSIGGLHSGFFFVWETIMVMDVCELPCFL